MEFWHEEKWADSKYRKGVIIFFTFHLFFFLFLLSVLKTIFNDPGELSEKYVRDILKVDGLIFIE